MNIVGSFPMVQGVPIAASMHIASIREQTAKGIDAHGQAFAPYTPDYANRGRAALGYQVTPVNLRRKETLLDSIYRDKNGIVTVPDKLQPIAEGLAKKRIIFDVHVNLADAMGVTMAANLDKIR